MAETPGTYGKHELHAIVPLLLDVDTCLECFSCKRSLILPKSGTFAGKGSVDGSVGLWQEW